MSSEGTAQASGVAEMDPQGAAERAAEEAKNAPRGDQLECVVGGELMFYLPDTRARVPGHVYSHDGLREVTITQMCEFHFDEVTQPVDDEDEVIDEVAADENAVTARDVEIIRIETWDGELVNEFLDGDQIRKGE